MRNVQLASFLGASAEVLLYFVLVGLGLLIAGLGYLLVRGPGPTRLEDLARDPILWPLQTLGVVGPTVLLMAARHPDLLRTLRQARPWQAAAGAARGMALGLGAGATAAGIALAWPAPADIGPGDGTGFLVTVWIQANVALTEETVFRGYLWSVLGRRLGPGPALILTSLLFALAHGANPAFTPTSPALLNLLLAGLVLGTLRRRAGFTAAVGWHFGWNSGLGGLFGLPVSGVTFPALLRVTGAAPPPWSGGAFGPEGGLAGTLALALSLGLPASGGWKGARRTILKMRRILP
mgnify:CR=1 FL=1